MLRIILWVFSTCDIAFVSSLSVNGTPNLAPYSFFNIFSSNPPLAIFSSNTRVTDGTKKDTLNNCLIGRELVINIVDASIVHKMTVASVEYLPDVDEFVKAGLTPIPSEKVAPYRIEESPAHLECKVMEVKTMGNHPGAANLVFCEIVLIHIRENVFMEGKDRVDPDKIKLIGRMGRSYYTHAYGKSIETIYQPILDGAIGYDQLPDYVKESNELSALQLTKIAGLPKLPKKAEIIAWRNRNLNNGSLDELIDEALNAKDYLSALCGIMSKELLE